MRDLYPYIGSAVGSIEEGRDSIGLVDDFGLGNPKDIF
jgi:hypothetical protein